MCVNQRLVYSRFLRYPIYVKCGHCPACLQEKAANRVRRIRNTVTDDMVQFMVTLTYARGMSPYVLRDEAYEFSKGLRDTLDVYRDCSVRKVRNPRFVGDYNQSYRFTKERVVLDTIDYVEDSSLIHTKDLKFEVGKIGVCYYKDYQHFIARLRLNLKRHFGYEGKLFVYACSEYGSKSLRPHFHLLFFVEKSIQASFKNAVVESWPYANLALLADPLREPSELHLMSRRMLISLLAFQSFLTITSIRNIRIPKVLVWVILTFHYLRYFKASNEALSHILLSKIGQDSISWPMFLIPHTLYIDSFQSSKVILELLLIRWSRICSELDNINMMNS